ncbi:hypothetical protein [Coleofasciculus sp.]|uniref:hypothetical protein n=1 Tax=Coleofasciculus sp. TaxID=3100458 RepID=UPI003A22E83D
MHSPNLSFHSHKYAIESRQGLIVVASLATVGAGLGTIVGAGLGTIVGAGLGTKFRCSPINEQQNPPSSPINEQQNPPFLTSSNKKTLLFKFIQISLPYLNRNLI